MKSVVLLSSGLDSTVNFYEALAQDRAGVVLCLTFDYGQRAAKKEILNSKKQCELNGIPHKVVDLKWFSEFTNTSLVSSQMDVPTDVKIESHADSVQSAKSVWVPNRNGIFLNIAAGFAEGIKADSIIVGFNKEEGATFPDNTQEYLDSMNEAFRFSTSNQIKIKCFTTDLDKTQIVKRAKELGVNFDLIWSCYFGEDQMCLKCESCLRYQRAVRNN